MFSAGEGPAVAGWTPWEFWSEWRTNPAAEAASNFSAAEGLEVGGPKTSEFLPVGQPAVFGEEEEEEELHLLFED